MTIDWLGCHFVVGGASSVLDSPPKWLDFKFHLYGVIPSGVFW